MATDPRIIAARSLLDDLYEAIEQFQAGLTSEAECLNYLREQLTTEESNDVLDEVNEVDHGRRAEALRAQRAQRRRESGLKLMRGDE